ncbi:hypothetical protein BBK36DRAFT_1164988 [Trichoderma citrinoviride]|uniref:DUF676 domain-containing protein n=1 Tax=Trichoderma citrinoviride TaxID=58853 RepID=A0A2T4BMG9_9HYPO|nr:hypothetical protein BBK36DRAFT_1164988 [Trichoderma citrinoviride]PTB70459.1 hypothetical protein BBK36DRAFT_1164988 [Trichoderma citrinoviride]
MPMIFSEHMEHYDLETIFPYRPGVIPPYQRIEVEYVQDPFHFRYPISHSPIVAIHCLNIEAKYHLHKDTWCYSSKLWPRDILPSCYEKRCRVMFFSWNNGLAVTEEESRFVKHGDRLLRLLMENRLEDPTRPIVFLCHGVGGLIVKEALAKAHLDKTGTIHIIDQCTRMLAFFNTPHHNVAKSVRNIASAAVNPTAPEVLDKLDKACEEHIERMAAMEERGRLYRRRVIINFHGSSLYRGKLLVEKEDAIINARPEYWEKYFPVYGDHTSMCRYPSSEDITCETVLKTIGLNTYLALRRSFAFEGYIVLPNSEWSAH